MVEWTFRLKCGLCSLSVLAIWFFLSLIIVATGSINATAVVSLILSSACVLFIAAYGVSYLIEQNYCSCLDYSCPGLPGWCPNSSVLKV